MIQTAIPNGKLQTMITFTFTLSQATLLLIALALLALLALCTAWFVHHQQGLKNRAHLMREAMHNHDFTFRISVSGLLPGERALQETLNDLGTDISRLVNENEVESWQRLIRVLSHEIMNATAPICSITQAYLNSPSIKDSPFEEGIKAIHSTGTALTAFTDSFRKLTRLQTPVLECVSVTAMVDKMRVLFPSMEWETDIPTSATVSADEGMLLQVMTNLAKNALEAGASVMSIHWSHTPLTDFSETPRQDSSHIHQNGTGRSSMSGFGPALLISNNGTPIPVSVRSNAFVPFFTTKPGGSGIGLALSRRLMLCQGGNLSLTPHPMPGWHVTFALEFPIHEITFTNIRDNII